MKNTLNASFYDSAAQGRSDIGIWIAGALCCLALYLIPTQALILLFEWLSSIFETRTLRPYYSPSYGYIANYNTYIHTLVVLVVELVPATIGLLTALWFVQKYLRNMPLLSVVTSAKKFRYKRMIAAALVFFGLTILYHFFRMIYLSGSQSDFSLSSDAAEFVIPGLKLSESGLGFMMGLPFILILGVLFAAAQEGFFRGFVDQGLSKYISNRIAAYAASAAFFTVMMFGVTDMYFGAFWFFASMFALGFALSFLTNLDNGIESAIGLQVASTVIYGLIIGYETGFTLPTWLLSAGPLQHNIFTFATNCAFYFIAVYILSIWRWGISEG